MIFNLNVTRKGQKRREDIIRLAFIKFFLSLFPDLPVSLASQLLSRSTTEAKGHSCIMAKPILILLKNSTFYIAVICKHLCESPEAELYPMFCNKTSISHKFSIGILSKFTMTVKYKSQNLCENYIKINFVFKPRHTFIICNFMNVF